MKLRGKLSLGSKFQVCSETTKPSNLTLEGFGNPNFPISGYTSPTGEGHPYLLSVVVELEVKGLEGERLGFVIERLG